MNTKKVVVILAGIVAVVGQFVPDYYLALVGGAVAAIVGFTLD